jgi:hypothetical protein
MLGSYDLGRYAAPPLRATGLVRQGLADDGKGRALCSYFLNNTVGSCQPLPGRGHLVKTRLGASSEAYLGSGQLVTRPDIHVTHRIRWRWRVMVALSEARRLSSGGPLSGRSGRISGPGQAVGRRASRSAWDVPRWERRDRRSCLQLIQAQTVTFTPLRAIRRCGPDIHEHSSVGKMGARAAPPTLVVAELARAPPLGGIRAQPGVLTHVPAMSPRCQGATARSIPGIPGMA